MANCLRRQDAQRLTRFDPLFAESQFLIVYDAKKNNPLPFIMNP